MMGCTAKNLSVLMQMEGAYLEGCRHSIHNLLLAEGSAESRAAEHHKGVVLSMQLCALHGHRPDHHLVVPLQQDIVHQVPHLLLVALVPLVGDLHCLASPAAASLDEVYHTYIWDLHVGLSSGLSMAEGRVGMSEAC